MITDISQKIETIGKLDLELDCEFYDPALNKDASETLTTQIRESDLDKDGIVFSHGRKILSCPYRKKGNIIEDYLIHHNVIAPKKKLKDYKFHSICTKGMKKLEQYSLKPLIVNIWTYFGIVDLTRAFVKDSGSFINDLIKGKYENESYSLIIEQNKRLETTWIYGDHGRKDYIPTQWIITINETDYLIFLCSKDIGALLGHLSYADASKTVGLTLENKDSMDDHKEDMRQAILDYPEDFIKYSLGDLHCKDIYDLFTNQIDEICSILGIKPFYPKLTIGSTVNQIMQLYYEKIHSIRMTKTKMEKYNWHKATSKGLLEAKGRSAQLLGKVDGGRCNNNKPFIPKTDNDLADIDISGCYASAMKSLSYPYGEPLIIDHAYRNGKIDDRERLYTLGKFLKDFDGELVDGNWIFRVKTKEGYTLKNSQDLIPSFIPPKSMENYKSDCDFDGMDILTKNDGTLKILTNQIINGIINSDILELLRNYSNQKAWKEYRNNLYVVSAIIYPKSGKCESIEDYFNSIKNKKGSTTTEVLFEGKNIRKTTIENHNHSWFEIPLKNPLKLLQNEREKYEKGTPQNQVLKTIINTIYGVSVSSKFINSNVVLAQNITARARVMAYIMEKGLNMFQTITDGGIFNPNKVIKTGKSKITLQNAVSIKSAKLNNLDYESLEFQSKKDLEQKSLNHLQNLFNDLSIMKNNIFSLEIKEYDGEYICNGGSFHGASNYLLNYTNKKVKMRGYNDDKTLNENGYKLPIIKPYLENVLENPQKIKRKQVTLESLILKTKDYRLNFHKYNSQNINCGQTIVKTKHFVEFSINQFNYKTYEQLKSWQKEIEKLKRKYGQSLEMFYVNKDGSLDYKRMIEEVYEDIQAWKMKPRALEKDKNNHNSRKYKYHPYMEDKVKMQNLYN